MTTVQKLYNQSFHSGREVQIREHSGGEVDGRLIWNTFESMTRELKDKPLTNADGVLLYNGSLKPIYVEMNNLIKQFEMDKSEFDPKSNHFFCQLMNLVDKKSNFEIKLNKIMQLGFNAGQLSVFLERKTLPIDRIEIISNFIHRNNMFDLDTYVSPINQEIINTKYLHNFEGGNYNIKKRHSRKNRTYKIGRSSRKKSIF
jgi:hypothetical protein